MKLMYITNRPEVAKIAQAAGVDWIFVDLETIGKQARQGGLDTVQSKHTVADVAAMRPYVKAGGLLVRVNPIYEGSQAEIDAVIAAGADIVMLPYFKSKEEVAAFWASLEAGAERSCCLNPRKLPTWRRTLPLWMG